MATQPIDDTGADDAGPANDGAPQLSEVETLAVEMGWKPKVDYTGPEEKWRPAKDWIKAGDNIAKGLKDDLKRIKDNMSRMERAGAMTAKRMLDEQRQAIEARFYEAIDNQDKAGATKAANDMRALENESRDPGEDVEATFAAENPWYGKDEDATAYAISVSNREARKGKTPAEQIEAAAAAVRKRFPDLFEDDHRPTLTVKNPPSVNERNARTVDRAKAKDFASLPVEAKRGADEYFKMFEGRGLKVDRAKFEREYAEEFYANAG